MKLKLLLFGLATTLLCFAAPSAAEEEAVETAGIFGGIDDGVLAAAELSPILQKDLLATLAATSRTLWHLHVQTAADYAMVEALTSREVARANVAPFALAVSPAFGAFLRRTTRPDIADTFQRLFTRHIGLISDATDAILAGREDIAQALVAGPLMEVGKGLGLTLQQINPKVLNADEMTALLTEHEGLLLEAARRLRAGDMVGAFATVVRAQVQVTVIADRLALGIFEAAKKGNGVF
ncbi:hypothetical protein HK104_002344 [Borealophlyctis nickersoniae]|nr:hypothetical protein HK104_002344 [Borealophlyctis nickersoniae]